MIIAIDGYSACGKSTLAKQLSNYFGMQHINSGSMYRCVAFYCFREKIDLTNTKVIESVMKNIRIDFKRKENQNLVYLNGEEVSNLLSDLSLSSYLTEVSTLIQVREKLVEMQRLMGEKGNVVMEGRDIGTVVFPDAEIKFFMTANIEVRAKRRLKELKTSKNDVSFDTVLDELKNRDKKDCERTHSPLRQANDAILIDNSNLTLEAQLELAIKLVKDTLK